MPSICGFARRRSSALPRWKTATFGSLVVIHNDKLGDVRLVAAVGQGVQVSPLSHPEPFPTPKWRPEVVAEVEPQCEGTSVKGKQEPVGTIPEQPEQPEVVLPTPIVLIQTTGVISEQVRRVYDAKDVFSGGAEGHRVVFGRCLDTLQRLHPEGEAGGREGVEPAAWTPIIPLIQGG